MANLLSNAIKFSPENSTVTIQTDVSDTKIRIAVADEGIGIPEDDLKHLFEPFFRTKNAQFIPGTGLGLHIIVQYLDLMNGTINCVSELGKGTKFIIEFNK